MASSPVLLDLMSQHRVPSLSQLSILYLSLQLCDRNEFARGSGKQSLHPAVVDFYWSILGNLAGTRYPMWYSYAFFIRLVRQRRGCLIASNQISSSAFLPKQIEWMRLISSAGVITVFSETSQSNFLAHNILVNAPPDGFRQAVPLPSRQD